MAAVFGHREVANAGQDAEAATNEANTYRNRVINEARGDAARITHLVELAIEFAQAHLKPDGALVCKVFHGTGYSQLVKMFKEQFRLVKPLKPKASRDKSSETFLVGIGPKKPR